MGDLTSFRALHILVIIGIQEIQGGAVAFNHGEDLPAVQRILRPPHQSNDISQLLQTGFIYGISLQNIVLQHPVGPFAKCNAPF